MDDFFTNTFPESDWQLFRKRLPEWNDRITGRLLTKYQELLSGPDSSVDKFWKLAEMVSRDQHMRVLHLPMSRARLFDDIICFMRSGVVTSSDLVGFSTHLLQRIGWLCRADEELPELDADLLGITIPSYPYTDPDPSDGQMEH